MNIFIHRDGTQYGPYTLEQLQQYVQQGSFSLQDLACYDGQNWVSVGQVPGIGQPATSAAPATPSGPSKRTRSAEKKSIPQQGQAQTQSTAKPPKGGFRKIILWGGIGGILTVIIAVVCVLIFSGNDEEEKTGEIAQEQKESSSEVSPSETKAEESAPSSSSATMLSVPMIDRIPSDAGAVILVQINDLLAKGEKDIPALLPPGLPPMVGKAFKDPSSLGLDVSAPLQIHLIHNQEVEMTLTGGLAGKLSDKEKFMTTIELLGGLDTPAQKDGYLLYHPIDGTQGSEPQIAIGADFFFIGGAGKPSEREPSIEKFMISDGENGLLANDESFAEFIKEKNDFSMWFGGDSILQSIGSQLDGADFSMLGGGSGTLTLNFEDGEMVAMVNFQAQNDETGYGKGSFSDAILSFAPADSILALGFAMDLGKFMEFAEKEVLPEVGEEVQLDEPVDELGGLTMRDAISSFTGEFLLSLTDIKMPDPSPMGGLPGGPMDGPAMDSVGNSGPPSGQADPFGDPGMQAGGEPPGGMDPGAMMMASMPKPEFIVAASIDTEKWLKLKSAPPLAMGLGLAMMQGISITEKNGFLLIASKDHIEATQSGLVKDPVSGPGKEVFESNDFFFKINVAPILKMDLPIPPGGPMAMLEEISHLEMVSNNEKSNGTGSLRLVLNDPKENSLSLLLQMIKTMQTMQTGDGMGGDPELEGDFQFE